VVVGFIAFRAFDILKPFPVGWLERRFSGGWGILLDDVMAGLYALVVVQLALAFLPE
jgi:phosphatidylglycerophosphatase A